MFYVRILNEFSIAITVIFTATHVIALNHVVAAGLTALLRYVPVVPQRWAAYTLIFSHRMQCVADSVRQIHIQHNWTGSHTVQPTPNRFYTLAFDLLNQKLQPHQRA